ncbi:hypothetical protein [Haloterrigena salifodinae]|uniref:hypothetical protein n=1 Tax=Haloterrigena salifodinae TaxID=2675099 RepID=UPI000F85CDCC|nr:hypothetical protein [Haloterrigena salifodinae]
MEYEYMIDPSSLIIESELLALRARIETAEKRMQEEGENERLLLTIPEPFLEDLMEGDTPLRDTSHAKFFASDDDRIATREQIMNFLEDHRWDNSFGETEDHPFTDQGYHERIAAVLDCILGVVEDSERKSWLVAARRKTINAFTRAERWVLETGTEAAENVLSNFLKLEDDEEVLTSKNVAVTLGKFATIGISATVSPPVAAVTTTLMYMIDP